MGIYFGTDGIRGIANEEIGCDLATRVGKALGYMSGGGKILVGRDTRESGKYLALALSSGAVCCGARVVDVGVIPTGGVSFLAMSEGFDFGVQISASHNSAEYNGIKIFDKFGNKLSEQDEEKIERYIVRGIKEGKNVGSYVKNTKMSIRYVDFLTNSHRISLKGTIVALDMANGATSRIAIKAFEKLGAKVLKTGVYKKGKNINENCGSEHIDSLAFLMKNTDADIGFAFDGDGDRVRCIEKNKEYDGDALLYVLASFLKNNNRLKNNAVVGTVQTNGGIEKSLKKKGIGFFRAQVGDKYVSEQIVSNALSLGGEQAGHIVLFDHLRTGDGILSALAVMQAIKESGKPLEKLFDARLFPQSCKNVKVTDKTAVINDRNLLEAERKIRESLSEGERILVRASGTENKIRILVEGENESENNRRLSLLEEAVITADKASANV